MLLGKVPVILVNYIKFPYKYILLDKEYGHYIKDYNAEEPLMVTTDKVIPLEKSRPLRYTVLFIYNNTYYFCPIFNALYNNRKNIIAMTDSVRMYIRKNRVKTVKFRFNGREYKTRIVKEVRVIK